MTEASLGRILKRLYTKMALHFNTQDVEWEIVLHPLRLHSPMVELYCYVRTPVTHPGQKRWSKAVISAYDLANEDPVFQKRIVDDLVRRLDESWNGARVEQ